MKLPLRLLPCLLGVASLFADIPVPPGPRSYAGREADAPWRKAALDRIEKHRKADFSVRVRGPDGEPLADTEVTLTLRRHEFGFGSAVTADLLTAETEEARRYREIVDRLFSRVLFQNDLKDVGWETDATGKEERKQRLDQAFGWLGGERSACAATT